MERAKSIDFTKGKCIPIVIWQMKAKYIQLICQKIGQRLISLIAM